MAEATGQPVLVDRAIGDSAFSAGTYIIRQPVYSSRTLRSEHADPGVRGQTGTNVDSSRETRPILVSVTF